MELTDIRDIDVAGKRVLVRADLNVPLEDGAVADGGRLRAALPTFDDIVRRGGRLVVMAHLGRPDGRRDSSLSLRPLADALRETWGGAEISFAEDCVGETARTAVAGMADGECVLLENLRFHSGEKADEADFAAALADLADIYVNDAFSASHRAHASIVGVPRRLPSAAGLLMLKEIGLLERLLSDPARPYAALLGGAKAETKAPVVERLVGRADRIMLGGVMATTFLRARGVEVGRSKIAEDQVETARRVLKAGDAAGAEIMLPVDVVVASGPGANAENKVAGVEDVPPDMMILDIGPETIRRYADAIGLRGTVVWNGPMGAAEFEPFQKGTHFLGAVIAERTAGGGLSSVAGGGDTTAFLRKHQMIESFSYASMAGGAFLQWLSGEPLPGIEALRSRR